MWLVCRPPQVVPKCCLRTQGSPLLHTNSYSSSGSPKLRCWCTVWRQGGVYFLLLILLMMLILLCFKCHWLVSCSISKVSQFVSACSAKSSSQGLCIFPIVISSLARAPGTVSSLFLWAHHWVFHSSLTSPLPLLQMQTTCSHFQSPSQFNPASYQSWYLLSFHWPSLCRLQAPFLLLNCTLPFMTGDKNLPWNQ